MSTFTGQASSEPLSSEKDLEGYFQAFAKPRECMRVGLEAEFFAVFEETGKALPYHGETGIHAILKALAEEFSYELILENGNIIGLNSKDLSIALEPGGQMELNAPPVTNVFGVADQLKAFFNQLRTIREHFPGVCWMASGMQPFSGLDEIEWVPKHRYEIMRRYLETHGSLSHEMMKRTATNQINFDYLSEDHAMANLRVVLGISSIVTATFANSSFSDGKPNGFVSKRLDIWNHTDPDRTGLMLDFIRAGRTFYDYLNYLLDMPMMFLVRGGKWLPLPGISFRNFIRQGFEENRATVGDFELHLSTAFPEARLKHYLEVRGVDCQSPDLIPAVAAFWKGILYREDAREQAWDLVSFASNEDRMKLHQEVPQKGLQAELGGRPILPIARQLVDLSCQSLSRQVSQEDDRDECFFLEKIREKIIRPGKSPGQTLIDKWNGEWGQDPAKLIKYLRI